MKTGYTAEPVYTFLSQGISYKCQVQKTKYHTKKSNQIYYQEITSPNSATENKNINSTAASSLLTLRKYFPQSKTTENDRQYYQKKTNPKSI